MNYYIFIYPIVKLILFIATIVCIVKNKKKNKSKEESDNGLTTHIIVALVIYYISTIITYIIGCYMVDMYIFWFAPIIITIIFLVIFFLSVKNVNKRVFRSILIGLITVSMIFNFFKTAEKMISDYYEEKRAQEYSTNKKFQQENNNFEYESYFGDYVSAANAKALLAKIKSNNTLYIANYAATDEYVPVYVVFKTMDSEEKIYTKPTEVIKQIKSSKHFLIKVYDENITEEEPEFEKNEENDENNENTKKLKTPIDWSGYYSNSYIRVILIEEVENRY